MSVFVLDALRTPVSSGYGDFNATTLKYLSTPVIRNLLEANQLEVHDIDYFIMGNALGGGGNPARLVALAAGLPEVTVSITVDSHGNSGMDAITLAADKIRLGQADVVIAGGAESFSRRPVMAYRPIEEQAEPVPYDRPAYTPWKGADPDLDEAAENLAADLSVSLAEQQQWARDSYQKAALAKHRLSDECVFVKEIVHEYVTGPTLEESHATAEPESEQQTLPQCETTELTAQYADAAAFVVLVSERWLQRTQRNAPVRLSAYKSIGSAADEPAWAMVDVCQSLLAEQQLSMNDFTVIELNEVSAAESIVASRQLALDVARVNRGGGSLARGNPIGAAGAVLLVRLFHELRAIDSGHRGLAASSAMAGLGTAVIFEAV